MFSSTTTELSINRESTRASPPSTMVLMVPPIAFSSRNAARQETGMEIKHRDRAAHRTQENQDHHGGQDKADSAFLSTLATAIFTYCD